jgi:hypothetical protein
MRNRTRLLMSAGILAIVVAAAAITGEASFGQGPAGNNSSAAMTNVLTGACASEKRPAARRER